MLNCTDDPLANYLKGFGYSVVLMPRGGIAPLQVAMLQPSRQLKPLGDLADVFETPPPPLPGISRNTASNLVGARSSGLKVGVGLKLLSGALATIGVKSLSGSAGFDKANSMKFQFGDVTVESVAFLALAGWLKRAGRVSTDPTIKAWFKAENLFIITDVLRARTLVIDAEDSAGGDAAIDLPAIQGVLDGKASVKLTGGKASRIELTSVTPLAFGIKAVQIFPEGRRLSTRFVAPDEVRLESDFDAEETQPIWLDLDSVVAT
jgi:hypothetical protein